jgi:hypothetical protein
MADKLKMRLTTNSFNNQKSSFFKQKSILFIQSYCRVKKLRKTVVKLRIYRSPSDHHFAVCLYVPLCEFVFICLFILLSLDFNFFKSINYQFILIFVLSPLQ